MQAIFWRSHMRVRPLRRHWPNVHESDGGILNASTEFARVPNGVSVSADIRGVPLHDLVHSSEKMPVAGNSLVNSRGSQTCPIPRLSHTFESGRRSIPVDGELPSSRALSSERMSTRQSPSRVLPSHLHDNLHSELSPQSTWNGVRERQKVFTR
jgi:hypothetical protein